MLYREGVSHPKMMSVGLHMRLSGHPSRAVGLERFLDHVMAHNDVWVCRREEIARHWMLAPSLCSLRGRGEGPRQERRPMNHVAC